MLSDVFTSKQHFEWMLEVLLEVQKFHPAEDELVGQYLVVGICKAAAVTGLVSQGELGCVFHKQTLKCKGLPQSTDGGFHTSKIAKSVRKI